LAPYDLAVADTGIGLTQTAGFTLARSSRAIMPRTPTCGVRRLRIASVSSPSYCAKLVGSLREAIR
jgi:hypothetical protein